MEIISKEPGTGGSLKIKVDHRTIKALPGPVSRHPRPGESSVVSLSGPACSPTPANPANESCESLCLQSSAQTLHSKGREGYAHDGQSCIVMRDEVTVGFNKSYKSSLHYIPHYSVTFAFNCAFRSATFQVLNSAPDILFLFYIFLQITNIYL